MDQRLILPTSQVKKKHTQTVSNKCGSILSVLGMTLRTTWRFFKNFHSQHNTWIGLLHDSVLGSSSIIDMISSDGLRKGHQGRIAENPGPESASALGTP